MTVAIQPEIFSNFKGVTVSCGASAPPWMPVEMFGFNAALPYRLEISKAERRVLRGKRSSGLASDWAPKDRIITSGPMAGHAIDFSITPFVPALLDAIDDPCVEEVSLCFAPQTTKSTLIDTFLGNRAVNDPGPALVVYPDKETAEENCRDRIKPMVDQSPSLRALKTGYAADEKGIKIKLMTMSIHMGWSGSATSLGNKSIRYLILDEKDKHKLTPNKNEAATYDLAVQRTKVYPYNRKIINASTPTVESGPIWQDITVRANVLFKYQARCPDCGHLQEMVFGSPDSKGGIKWPVDIRDPKDVRDKFLAWYQCENCTSKWDDLKRNKAVQGGGWFAADGRSIKSYLKAYRPKHIAAHLAGWYSPFVSLSDAAASFLEGVTDKLKLKNYCNNFAAEPWLEYEKDVDKEIIKLKALEDDRPEGMVPGNGLVATLVGGVDTQDNGFYYKICAVGYGLTHEFWTIRKGFVDSLDALDEILWLHEYLDATGKVYPVQFTVMDAMGHRTAEVYDFCRTRPGKILPAKGERTKAQPHTFGNLEYYPGTKKVIPGGLKLININTKYFKDMLDAKLNVAPSDPGAFHFHANMGDDFFRQMTAECRDDNGFWIQIGSRPNHYWDVSANCMVAADVLQVKHWPTPAQVRMKADHHHSSHKSSNERGSRPSWMDKRR